MAGNVNLRGRHRFREGKLAILDHHAAQQGDKQNAERAAHQHQDRRLQIGMLEVENRPRSRDDKGRNGEDGASGHRLANRADGSSDVLFQDRALHEPQYRHSDDGGGIGSGDGHAGAKAEVGVSGAENDRHDQAEKHGADGKLCHWCVVRDERPERLFLFFLRSGSDCHKREPRLSPNNCDGAT